MLQRKKYDDLLNDCMLYTWVKEDDIEDWYPSGRFGLVIVTKDNGILLYDSVYKGISSMRSFEEVDDEEWKRHFSRRLRLFMMTRNMSQNELSELTGISKSLINGYCKGRNIPSSNTIDKISSVLNCSSSDLIDIRIPNLKR